MAIKPSILSDHNSGGTDRVVIEWEFDNIAELEAIGGEVEAYPEAPELVQEFFGRLEGLI